MHASKPIIFFFTVAVVNFLCFKFLDFTVPIHIDPVDFTYVALNLLKSYFAKGEFALWSAESFGGSILGFGGSWDWKVLPFLAFFETMDAIVLYGSILTALSSSFFYLMARQVFFYSPLVASLGAIFWAFNPFNMMYIYDHVFCTIYMWVPIFIWGLYKLSVNPYAVIVLFSLAMADQLFTGRLDSLEHMSFVVICCIILNIFTDKHDRWRNFIKSVAVLVGSAAICLLLLAPFLSDFFNNFMSSARLGSQVETYAQPLWPFNFFQWIPKPLVPGDWIAYLGPVGFFPIFFAFLAKKSLRDGEWLRNIVFFALASFVLLFYYNVFGVFDSYYKSLPFHNGVRYTLRFAPPFYFFLSFPLMTGFSQIERAASLPKISKYLGQALGVIALILAVLVLDRSSWTFGFDYAVAILLVLQGVLFYWATSKNLLRSNFSKLVLALVCLANSLLPTILSKWPNFTELHTKTHKNPEFESVLRFLQTQGQPPYSFRFLNDSLPIYGFEGPTLWLYLVSQGFQDMIGYTVFTPSEQNAYLQAVFKGSVSNRFFHDPQIEPPVNAWRINNIKYFLGKKGAGYAPALDENQGVKTVFTSSAQQLTLYEVADSLPRFYSVQKSALAVEGQVYNELNDRLDKDYSWFKNGVLLEDEKFFASIKDLSSYNKAKIEVQHYGSNSIRLNVETLNPTILIALERFDPWRWKLRIDGKTEEYVRANGLYRAVKIPEGKHEVEFYYALPRYTYILSSVGFAILFVLAFLGLRFAYKNKA